MSNASPDTSNDEPSVVSANNSTTVPERQPSSLSVRSHVGRAMHTLSDFVNENLIMVRYATMSTVLILGIYSISQSPPFFRYKRIQDLPAAMYRRRSRLTCQVMKVEKPPLESSKSLSNSDIIEIHPIVFHVRHLSLMERLFMKPRSSVEKNGQPTDSLQVQLSDGIMQQTYGGVFSTAGVDDDIILGKLIRDGVRVQCQFLYLLQAHGEDDKKINWDNDASQPSAAIRMSFLEINANPWLFGFRPRHVRVDVGALLVETGQARLAEDERNQKRERRLYGSTQHQWNDVKYLEALQKKEREAIVGSRGIWRYEEVRKSAKDLVEQVEWEAKSSWWQRAYTRWFG